MRSSRESNLEQQSHLHRAPQCRTHASPVGRWLLFGGPSPSDHLVLLYCSLVPAEGPLTCPALWCTTPPSSTTGDADVRLRCNALCPRGCGPLVRQSQGLDRHTRTQRPCCEQPLWVDKVTAGISLLGPQVSCPSRSKEQLDGTRSTTWKCSVTTRGRPEGEASDKPFAHSGTGGEKQRVAKLTSPVPALLSAPSQVALGHSPSPGLSCKPARSSRG